MRQKNPMLWAIVTLQPPDLAGEFLWREELLDDMVVGTPGNR
jgi:hypothetical protein